MASILFLIRTTQRSEFRSNDLKNKNLFFKFFKRFWNANEILNISKINMALLTYVSSKIPTPRDVVR